MAPTEEACLRQWREDLLSHARGNVLELGAGTGLNLEHYPKTVERLQLSEPDAGMRSQLESRVAESGRDVEVLDWQAESLPARDNAYDTVVATLVLCSVETPLRALAEVGRVLKPGGQFLFIEHVAAEEGSGRYRWQRLVEPVWKRVAGNCHVTRHTEARIEEAGFELRSVTRESMRKSLSIVRPTIRGVAVHAVR